jgi:hypothetical protein
MAPDPWDPPDDVLHGDLPDPRTRHFNPWERFDPWTIFGRLGPPWRWPPDLAALERWLWLQDQMARWLAYLQQLADDLDHDRVPGEEKQRELHIRHQMRAAFGDDQRPLGPLGGVFTGHEQPALEDWGDGENGDFQRPLADFFRDRIATVLDLILGATIGHLLPADIDELAHKYAAALVAEMEVHGELVMQGRSILHGKVRNQALHAAALRRCARAAFDLAYRSCHAIDVRLFDAVTVGAQVGDALGALIDLIRSAFNSPRQVLEKIMLGENPLDAVHFPSIDEIEHALNVVKHALEHAGNIGGLRPKQARCTLSPFRVAVESERQIVFQAFAGPISPPNLPTPASEVYPIAFLNAAVVPPWSDYFLVELRLMYRLTLSGDALLTKEGIDRALRKVARDMLDDVRQRILDGLRSGIIPPH